MLNSTMIAFLLDSFYCMFLLSPIQFLYYTNVFSGHEKTPSVVKMDVEVPNIDPLYLNVYKKAAELIINTANNKYIETMDHLHFPVIRFNQQQAFFAIRFQFSKKAGNLSEVFIHGIAQIHNAVVQAQTEKYSLSYLYVKCCEIAKFVGESFVVFPSPLICALHRFCLSYLDVMLLSDYLILCRFVNQVNISLFEGHFYLLSFRKLTSVTYSPKSIWVLCMS